MIALSQEACSQIDRLIATYEASGQLEAAVTLLTTLDWARQRIASTPRSGLEAPGADPALKTPGRGWIVEEHFWLSYSLTTPPVISGVFFVEGDVPGNM